MKDRSHKVLIQTGILLAGLASFAGLYQLISIAIEKILSGKGLDTYRTVWLVENNYIGFVVFLVSAIFGLAIAGATHIFYKRQEKKAWQELDDLAKKYKHSRSKTN